MFSFRNVTELITSKGYPCEGFFILDYWNLYFRTLLIAIFFDLSSNLFANRFSLLKKNKLCNQNRYPIDLTVTTSDGFILSLQHIPHGLKGNNDNNNREIKPVVFLQHGLLDSSATWVMNSAQESLPFILADQGFDVWMGNNRGNFYSNTNTKYNPDQSEFWQW